MERIPVEGLEGVSVSVAHNGQDLAIGERGYLGRLPIGKALLDVLLAQPKNIHGFTVDGRKNIVPKKNLADEGKQEKHYQLNVRIEQLESGTCITRYPWNHMRLLVVEESCMVQIWEIALISQNGNFFLTTQQTHRVRCYEKDGKIVCPRLKWPQMDEFLNNLPRGQFGSLMPMAEYQPDPEEPTSDRLEPGQGFVVWSNFAGGTSAIITKKDAARVHWSQIRGRHPLAFLRGGEIVTFTSLIKPEGDTSFENEALGVTPLIP